MKWLLLLIFFRVLPGPETKSEKGVFVCVYSLIEDLRSMFLCKAFRIKEICKLVYFNVRIKLNQSKAVTSVVLSVNFHFMLHLKYFIYPPALKTHRCSI